MSAFGDLFEKAGSASRTTVALVLIFLVVPSFGAFVLWSVASILFEMKQQMPGWLLSYYLLAPKVSSAIVPLLVMLPVVLIGASVVFGIQKESKNYARNISRRETSPATIPELGEENTSGNRLRQSVIDT
jgi:hypothetical protein